MKNLLLIFSSVFLNAIAQLCIRKGMLKIGEINSSTFSLLEALPVMMTNFFIWISLFCYGVSILLWMVVLSKVEVSYAYPFLSVGYVITALFGYFFFHENISFVRCFGIAVICLGVILISRS